MYKYVKIVLIKSQSLRKDCKKIYLGKLSLKLSWKDVFIINTNIFSRQLLDIKIILPLVKPWNNAKYFVKIYLQDISSFSTEKKDINMKSINGAYTERDWMPSAWIPPKRTQFFCWMRFSSTQLVMVAKRPASAVPGQCIAQARFA